jgi:aldehyde dehydrogenase (NAD+)
VIGDAKQAMRVSGELQAGTVWVNQYGILHASVRTSPSLSFLVLGWTDERWIAFGGFKTSGIGRELGSAGLHEYLTVKSVHHNISEEMWVLTVFGCDVRWELMIVSS